MQNVPEYKVIFVGDPSVGKTSIIQQYYQHVFDEDSESTVGASFVLKTVKTEKGDIDIHIWDTAGQERYRSLIPMYSRNAIAAIIVVDITNPETFNSCQSWLSILKENCLPQCKIYIDANKIDLEPVVSINEVKTWSESKNFPFFTTSAKDFDSIDFLFRAVATDIILNCNTSFDKSRETVLMSNKSEKKCC